MRLLLDVVGIVVGLAIISKGRADEAYAQKQFKAMSDNLGAQKAMSFEYDVSLEIVSTNSKK